MAESKNKSSENLIQWDYRPLTILSLILVGASYMISIAAYALNGRTILDADEAAEMVLASHLNRTGRFISPDWYYSTELRVLNTQIVNKLALSIFPNSWHAARTLAIAILVLILLASYLYLVRAARLGWIGVLSALALVVPFSTTYSYIVLYGSFYVPHISITFILLALTLQAMRSRCALFIRLNDACPGSEKEMLSAGASRSGRKLYISVVSAACALSLIAGLGGVRQFLVFHAPLFLTSLVLLFLEKHQEDSLHDILSCKCAKLFLISIAETIFCVLGVGINSVILHRFFVFSEYTKTSLNSLKVSEFLDYLGSLIHIWGYEGCAELRDITGAAAVCGLILCAIFVLIAGFLIRRYRRLDLFEKIFLLFFLFGLLTNVIFYLFANLPVPRYLMPAAVMILPLIPIAFRQEEGFGTPWRRLILAFFCLCLFVQSTNYFWYYAFKDKGRAPTSIEQAAAWLEDNDLTEGFATFWNSDILTELSDGKIEMWTLHKEQTGSDWSECELYDWLQVKAHSSKLPEARCFLLLTEDEIGEIDAAGMIPFLPDPALQTGKYRIYVFDSAADLFGGPASDEQSGPVRINGSRK